MMAFTTQSEKKSQVGYLRVRFLSKRFRFYFFLMMDF